MKPRSLAVALLSILAVVTACSERKLRPLNPCTVTAVVQRVDAPSGKVDLVFVIDDSKSMADEQAALGAQIENVVEVLLSGEVPGAEPFPPVESLRVGVVGTDMGVLGIGEIPTAVDANATTTPIPDCGDDAEGRFFGEDGAMVLSTSASPLPNGCLARYPSYLQYDAGDDVASFATAVRCTALLGTSGCGFEMQLEAMLAAVTDGSRAGAPAFAPTTGDGAPRDRAPQAGPGGRNEGFFRDDSVIAIVVVTDEEDCSTDDPEMFMFRPSESTLQDAAHADEDASDFRVNTRCLFFEDRLYGIERYVEGLRALRPDAPGQVVFAGIVGIPEDLGDDATPAEILDDPRMAYADVLADDGTLEDAVARWSVFTEPACFRCASDPSVTDWRDCPDDDEVETIDRNEDLQWAAPGRRFVELGRRLDEEGMRSVFRSICADDFGPAMEAILGRIGEALRGSCLPRALERGVDGRVHCDVVERLPTGMHCTERADAGREPVRVETSAAGEAREVCRIAQLAPTDADRAGLAAPVGVGWYYDDYTAETERCGGEPGAPRQRIAFTEGALPTPGAGIRLECIEHVGEGNAGGAGVRVPCGTQSDCPGGFVCAGEDLRPPPDGCGAAGCTCVNPTCDLGEIP